MVGLPRLHSGQFLIKLVRCLAKFSNFKANYSVCVRTYIHFTACKFENLQVSNLQVIIHPIFFLKMYHFMFHFMSSLVTWDAVILVLIILKTHVWLHDF